MNLKMTDYADSIVNNLLKLKRGDCLSINTEECDFEFAKTVAETALKKTDVQIKIVLTDKGRPVDVAEFDPPLTDTKPETPVLLRIAHIEKETEPEGKILDIKIDKDNLSALQKLGHLAEPVILNRRISIPYCVVPSVCDGFDFNIEKKLEQIDYRQRFLNSADIDSLRFAGENNDFSLRIPDENFFGSCHIKLSNGRDFVNSADYEAMNCMVDKNSLNGTVNGSAVILGRKQNVKLDYENGKLVRFSASAELEQMFSFDEMLKTPGFLSLKDGCFKLYLGGSLLQCFEKEPESEEEIPSFFNTSLYSVCIELPSKADITYCGCDGRSRELVRRGFFII